MVTVVVVMHDKSGDGGVKRALQIMAFQQDAVLEGLLPTRDLALRLRGIGRTAGVIHAVFAKGSGKAIGDVCAFASETQPRGNERPDQLLITLIPGRLGAFCEPVLTPSDTS